MKKKVFIFGMVTWLVLQLGGIATAAEYSANIDIPPSSYIEDRLHVDPIGSVGIPIQRSSLESSYISPYITSVKDQNPYGTCWAFASVAASEASIIKEGLMKKEDIDLSEWQLAYYLTHSVTDPLGGTRGDSFNVDGDYLQVGGNQEMATYRLANWYGLVDENTAPYETVLNNSASTLSDEVAYSKDVMHLENAYWISMKDHAIVKQMIKQYGACGAAYWSEGQYYSTGYEFSSSVDDPLAFYCPTNKGTNHGVTIVGWDDNFDKNNFGTYKPNENGAWYCKNSWGDYWGNEGYFWISYEDVPLLAQEAFFFDYGKADNYDNNYQYDGGAWGAAYSSEGSANVYTSQQDEYLKAVGFYTVGSNYDCKIEVYKNPLPGNPVSGTLMIRQDADQMYAGFHTVELDREVALEKNDTFSVVVYQSDSTGEDAFVITDKEYAQAPFRNVSAVEAGQSYLVNGTHSIDMVKYGANCRIKAYTDNKIHVASITLNASTLEMNTGETADLYVTSCLPEDASDKSVEWSSGDTSIATVDVKGKVTAKKGGSVTIYCSAKDGSGVQAKCEIIVNQLAEEVMLNYRTYSLLKGESVQLSATVLPSNTKDKSVRWSTSDESIAIVSDIGYVTAVGYGTTTITCEAIGGKDCKAVCTLYVLEEITAITLNYSSATLNVGEQLSLVATITPTIEKTKGVYWISSNEDCVKVDANGQITAVAPGKNIEIKCIAKDGKGALASCYVTVKAVEQDSTTSLEGTDNTDTDNTDTDNTDTDSTSALLEKQYKISSNGTAKYHKWDGTSTIVTIPDMIVIDGKNYKVTSIADNAFKNNKQVTNVIIGKNVKSIGANAFYNCKKLKTITLGTNVTTIGDKAFYQCGKLTKITIPSKVNKIGKQAFYKCKNLKTITIKTSKLTSKKIGKNAFKGIHSKATIKVPKKKLTAYKKLLKGKGVGSKVKIKK